MTMHAFVSLSHHDLEFVRGTVMPAVRSAGVEPWIYDAAVPGDNWVEAVLRHIRDGDWFIVSLTETYQDAIKDRRGACYTELLWIVDQAATSRRKCRLIVVWRAGEVPDLLRAWNAIDVRSDLSRLESELKRAADADRNDARPCLAQDKAPAAPVRALPRPAVSGPIDLPELARYNFNSNAKKYFRSIAVGKSMQRGNAEVLLRHFGVMMSEGKAKRPETWLDAGCGTGLLAYLFDDLKGTSEFAWMNDCRIRAGFDYAPEMLAIVNAFNQTGHWYTHTFESDLRHFGSDTLMKEVGPPRVDLIVANNVFHWLFAEDVIEKSFSRLYETLDRNGGCLAASIAAIGTGSEFFKAYRAEVEDRLPPTDQDRWRRHLQNPIGLQSVEAVVDIARRCRFRIERAQQVYEPIVFDSTDEYVRDVRAYGEEVLMAPLLQLSSHDRELVWNGIARRFKELHRAKFNQTRYVHNQFVIYMLAVRHD
jgi:SAM-dependent methyltransferase